MDFGISYSVHYDLFVGWHSPTFEHQRPGYFMSWGALHQAAAILDLKRGWAGVNNELVIMHSKDGLRIDYARAASFEIQNGSCVIRD